MSSLFCNIFNIFVLNAYDTVCNELPFFSKAQQR